MHADFDPRSLNERNRRNELSVKKRKPSGLALWMKSPSLRFRSVILLINEHLYSLLAHSQVADLEATIVQRDKELLYLKRALESVYSRFRSREEPREPVTDVDAALLASRAIEEMAQKEKEVAVLKAEITELKIQLSAKPKFITEKDFKAQVAPPPPPPPGSCALRGSSPRPGRFP